MCLYHLSTDKPTTIFLCVSVYNTIGEAVAKHPEVDVMVNFASFRSAYDVTLEAMNFPSIKTIAIIAEGIPENLTRKLILAANEKEVTIIGKRVQQDRS